MGFDYGYRIASERVKLCKSKFAEGSDCSPGPSRNGGTVRACAYEEAVRQPTDWSARQLPSRW